MPATEKLTKKAIENAPTGKRLGDGGGLFLHVRDGGAKFWSLQVTIKAAYGRGRRIEMGLGPYHHSEIDEVRETSRRYRKMARLGTDPRDHIRAQIQTSQTFEQVCALAFEARKAELKGGGTAGRWMSPLNLYVIPKLGNRPIDKITQNDIKDTLAPIWHDKHETAKKAIGRINVVIKHAAAMGIDVDMQAVEKAKLLLGKSRHKTTQTAAMPWADVPAFYSKLGDDVSDLALRLLILTGLRTAPVRMARLEQIQGDTWVVPAANMKGAEGATTDFRVPLSAEAQRVIALATAQSREGFLFPDPYLKRKDVVINENRIANAMKDKHGVTDATPHGFRSSLRTWLSETTDAPREVAESVLAHSIGGKVEVAYNRTDFLERRAVLMERWAKHLTQSPADVVQLAV